MMNEMLLALDQLKRSDRGLNAINTLLKWLDDDGIGLDGLNQTAVITMLEYAWRNPESGRREMRRFVPVDDTPEVEIHDERAICPKCARYPLIYVEDIQSYRDVGEFDGDKLMVDSGYKTGEGFDEGSNGRLYCRTCCIDLKLPEGMEIDFV